MKQVNSILSGYGTTVFTVMTALANEHRAINLGQGFPDWEGPEDVRQVAADAAMSGSNQYPPMQGIPELRQAVAEHDRQFYGIDADWRTEVLVTSGGTEALTASLMGLLNPGDEVVLIEPLYDSYLPIVRLAGAVPKMVRLEPPYWSLPREELAAAFSDRTKLLMLNSPMNPAAKVFNRDELSFIAGLLERHDAFAVCDEVHEHLVYDGVPHIPLMTLPGMRERVVRVASAGKTFSLTGWKVGYVTAAAPLAGAIAKAHQFLTFTTAPNLQKAVAFGLSKERSYFEDMAGELQRKRDLLRDGLGRLGFGVLPSAGTYFIGADIGAVANGLSDVEFCRAMTVEGKITALPFSAFYQDGGADNFVRFCFCKGDDVLIEALERIGRFLGR